MITDPGVARAGLLEGVTGALGPMLEATFLEVPQDSGIETVDAAALMGREAEAPTPSSASAAGAASTPRRATAVCLGEGGKAIDYVGIYICGADRPRARRLADDGGHGQRSDEHRGHQATT